jgi:hypothetical protein
MPLGDLPRKTYSILVSRSVERTNAELYEFDLPEPIPAFPVPLRPEDPEPWINLQELINDIYTRARFALTIDYSQALQPGLSEQDQKNGYHC